MVTTNYLVQRIVEKHTKKCGELQASTPVVMHCGTHRHSQGLATAV